MFAVAGEPVVEELQQLAELSRVTGVEADVRTAHGRLPVVVAPNVRRVLVWLPGFTTAAGWWAGIVW